MKLYLILTKKSLAIIFASLIVFLIIMGQIASAQANIIDGSTHALRENYIKGLGYNINQTEIESKQILIPQEFNDVYKDYNILQKQAGFNLEKHKGQEATIYTYTLRDNEEVQIHLIVSKGIVIGGDVASVKLDGDMKPLKKS